MNFKTASKRIIASAIAGYLSLTMAAFFTGVEFGIQPILHHTAAGVPLYMPYPLSVTIPVMVIEHILGFGFLEALITALIFAYIRRTDTSLIYGEISEAQKNEMKRAVPT